MIGWARLIRGSAPDGGSVVMVRLPTKPVRCGRPIGDGSGLLLISAGLSGVEEIKIWNATRIPSSLLSSPFCFVLLIFLKRKTV